MLERENISCLALNSLRRSAGVVECGFSPEESASGCSGAAIAAELGEFCSFQRSGESPMEDREGFPSCPQRIQTDVIDHIPRIAINAFWQDFLISCWV